MVAWRFQLNPNYPKIPYQHIPLQKVIFNTERYILEQYNHLITYETNHLAYTCHIAYINKKK